MGALIVLAVRESEYIEPVLHYVHHSEYGDMLRISAFSRQDTFLEYMKGPDKPDAVVGDPAFIESWLLEGKSSVPWAVLSGSGERFNGTDGLGAGGKVIAKYQALPSLLEAILQLGNVERSRAPAAAGEETLLLGVVSATGCCGKTTVALNISKLLGGLGLSVFYLNLESVDSSGMFVRMPPGHATGLERMLYELKSGGGEAEVLRERILDPKPYAVRHESLHADAFRPVENLREMLQLTRQDALRLLDCFAGKGRYDAVIVDTGSIEAERTQAVLERCGLLLWVLRSDEGSLYKTGRWLAHCSAHHSDMPQGIREKSRFILNFASDQPVPEAALDTIMPDGVLPYVASWGLPHQGELRLHAPQFQAGIRQLCMDLVEPMLSRVFTGSLP